MTEVNTNRDTLISMLAISEDITRTNSRIYELLRSLMNNPQELTNIKTSIDNLYDKVVSLKESNIGIPLIEEEVVVVPGPLDMSPREDIEYEKLLQQQDTPKPEIEELTPQPELELEPVKTEIPPRKSQQHRRPQRPQRDANNQRPQRDANNQRPQRDAGRRPNKPLKNKKKLPSPDVDSI